MADDLKTFQPDIFLRLGDAGFLFAYGNLFFGRVDAFKIGEQQAAPGSAGDNNSVSFGV